MGTQEKTRLEVLSEEKAIALAKINEGIEILNETENLSESKAALASVDEQIKVYNKKSGEIYLESKVTSGKSGLDIMKDVIADPCYETLAMKIDKEIGVYKTESRNKFMPTENVHSKAKGGIGVDKNWIFYAHKLNYLMAVRLTEEVIRDEKKRLEIANSYEMKDAVRAVLFPEGIDPLKDIDRKKDIISNKNLTAAIKYVINAMVGEEFGNKVISFHTRYICQAYAEHDKKKIGGGLKLADDRKFVRLLIDVCYKIMNDEEFEISGKAIKK